MNPLQQLTGNRGGGISWLSALIGILIFALLDLVLSLLLPGRLGRNAALIVDAVAAVLAVVIAPFVLRLFDQMQQRVLRQNNELRSLRAIDSAISGTLDLQTVLEVAIKEATLAVDGEVGALWLFAEESRWPHPIAQAFYNVAPGTQSALTERLGAGETDLARRTGVPQRRQGLEESWSSNRAAATLKLRNLIVVPIKQGESVLGVFLIGNRGGALNPLQGFADEDQTLLEAISATIAVAVQNARLHTQSRQSDDRLRALVARTGDAIGASSDAPLLMQILADEAARILPCQRVAVYEYKEERQEFAPLAVHDDEAARDETDKGRVRLENFWNHPLGTDVAGFAPAVTDDPPQGDVPSHYVRDAPTALGLDRKEAAFLSSPGYLFVLRSRDRRGIGLLCLLDAGPHLRRPAVADFARALAAQASVALENAQLARQTQSLLKQTQALQAATNQIAAELDGDRVLEGIVGSARSVLGADGYALWGQRPEPGEETALWRRRAASGLLPEARSELPAENESDLLSSVLSSRAPQTDSFPADSPIRALLALPLLYAGQATGVLTLYYQQPRVFAPDEIALAGSFANQAANALENARLYAEMRAMYAHQKEIAGTLQQSLLPPMPRRVGGIEFGYKYQAALQEALIGGDFFDVFDLGEDKRGLVMADVSGKGLKAAVQTAMLKYTLRGFAQENPDAPGRVIARVNDVLCSPMSSHEGFVTLFYGVLDTRTGALLYANAGHEPPLQRVAATGGVQELDACDGLALGALPGFAYDEAVAALAPGDLLLLYTDGLTEARAEGGDFLGTDGLSRLLPPEDVSAQEAVETIYSQVSTFADDVRRDDVAMLLLRRLPESDTPA